MERLEKPEAKGILAFLSSTPPKSAENAEKEREEREKASAEKRAKVEHKRSELQALRARKRPKRRFSSTKPHQ